VARFVRLRTETRQVDLSPSAADALIRRPSRDAVRPPVTPTTDGSVDQWMRA